MTDFKTLLDTSITLFLEADRYPSLRQQLGVFEPTTSASIYVYPPSVSCDALQQRKSTPEAHFVPNTTSLFAILTDSEHEGVVEYERKLDMKNRLTGSKFTNIEQVVGATVLQDIGRAWDFKRFKLTSAQLYLDSDGPVVSIPLDHGAHNSRTYCYTVPDSVLQ
jgi:hypothetical protein